MGENGTETIHLRPSRPTRTALAVVLAGMVGFGVVCAVGVVAIPAGLIDDGEDYGALALVAMSALALALAAGSAYVVVKIGPELRRATTCTGEGIAGLYFQPTNAKGRVQWWREKRYSDNLVPWIEVASVRCASKSSGEGSVWVLVIDLRDGTEAETAGRSAFRKRVAQQVEAVDAFRATSLDLAADR